jgi:hypothetical protein
VNEAHRIRQRVAARDALAARTRRLTGAALTISAVLSGVFAGFAAASAPGHRLLTRATARSTPAAKDRQLGASARAGTAIPPLPAPPGPGNLSAAPPTPAPAPSATQAPPVVVSGGS